MYCLNKVKSVSIALATNNFEWEEYPMKREGDKQRKRVREVEEDSERGKGASSGKACSMRSELFENHAKKHEAGRSKIMIYSAK